ncbi:hypothetical protein KSP39_PZI021522 [Platanthera zijinensis]|uniref:Uncharacterized protein n=1 Tax=Platanthera zijinensis TaxID=2320716 RepID=A0AAP0AWT4_9ASPA
MEEALKELEETKIEMEMLKVDYKAKCQFSESLRRALDEQLIKFQNLRVESDRQAKEIDAKSEEIGVKQQKYEDLLTMFQEKDSALKQLSSASEISRTRFKEKIKDVEELNRELVSSLEEANAKEEKQGTVICAYRKEILALERLLSESQKKCSDAELRAQAPKEVRRRDEMLDEFERKHAELVDQLKWKNEQFNHLEEAFNKVQGEFRASKEEWASERSNFLSDISGLQSSLDGLSQVSKNLRSELQMCNQVLAHEESRRRLLEIQMSESKEMYENIVMEYEEVKSNIGALTARRDEEIASVRNSLSEKILIIKELEYKSTHLKQENQELLEQIREAREAQIIGRNASSSLKSLRQKLRALEVAHKVCAEKLKARKVDWNRQIKRVTNEMNGCLLKLNDKDEEIRVLKEELEYSHCSVIQSRMNNEEISVVNMILESKFMEICSDIKSYELEVELSNERAAFLTEQLDNKSIALTQALEEVFQARKKAGFLKSKVDELESVNEEFSSMQTELASSKAMVAELLRNVDRVKEQAAQKELNLQENLRSTSYALDEVKFELQRQRNVMGQLKKIKCDLEIVLKGPEGYMEDAIVEEMGMEKVLMEVKELFFQLLEERERRVLELGLQNVVLEEHFTRINFDNNAVPKLELPYSVTMEMEEKLTVSSRVADKIVEFSKLNDALDKLITAQILDKHELEYRSLLILELEKYIDSVLAKLKFEEILSSSLASSIEQLEEKSAAEIFRLENELERICSNRKSLNEEIEAEFKRRVPHETIGELSRLSELPIQQIMELGDVIGKVSNKGEDVKKKWDAILQIDSIMDAELDLIMTPGENVIHLL